MEDESTYYRIISAFVGKETVFVPDYAYEQIVLENGVYRLIEVEEGEGEIREVCFAKSLEGCLLAINMYLKEQDYFIYKTIQPPCIDLSSSGIGDFPAIEEVRYREAVACEYVGKIFVDSYLIHCLQETYKDCNPDNRFDYERAKREILRFRTVRDLVKTA